MTYLPNRTSVAIAVHLRIKLTFTIFFLLLPDQFDAFSNPKNVSATNAINITPPSIGQVDKTYFPAHPPPTTLFNIEPRRQCQPLIFPPSQASNGAPGFVKYLRSNAIIRVRRCRIPKYSNNSFKGFKHNKYDLDRSTGRGSTNKIGVNATFLLR